MDAAREELAYVTDQLRGVGDWVDDTDEEIDALRASLARSVEKLNRRLGRALHDPEPGETKAHQPPAWASRLPYYAAAMVLLVLASTGLVLYRMPTTPRDERGDPATARRRP